MSRFTALEADGGLNLDDLVPNQPVNQTKAPPKPPVESVNLNDDGPTGPGR